jgi:hypothetical protein
MKYLGICCIIKDENAYLQEWMKYHAFIGVEHFIIYDNGNKVPIEQSLMEWGCPYPVVICNIKGWRIQMMTYTHCIKHFRQYSKWLAFIDVDEFIVPKTTEDLQGFLKNYEEYGGLGVNWRMFGSSGFIDRPSGLQVENFTMCTPTDFPENRQIKTILQPEYAISARDPHSFIYRKGYFCVNEDGERIDGPLSRTSINRIQLNHYFCRSRNEFKEKTRRGGADGFFKDMDMFEYIENCSSEEDKSIFNILHKWQGVNSSRQPSTCSR